MHGFLCSSRTGCTVEPKSPVALPGDALERMVAQMPTAVALLAGADHVYRAASQSYLRIAGKRVLGRTYREAFPELQGQGYFEVLDRVFQTGEPFSARGITAAWDADESGTPEPHFIDISVAPVRDDAGVVEAVTLTVEVVDDRVRTERELAVERSRLEFVFQQAPAFLAVLRGPKHTFTLVNDAYLQLVGHREVVGRPVLDALPEIRGQGYAELLDEVLQTGIPFLGREMAVMLERTPGAAPEERYIDLSYTPLTNAEGEREGVIAHGTDVTDAVRARRQVEALLTESEQARGEAERARAEAEEANRAKSVFLASMSHELRTPINAILGYAELLEGAIVGPVTPLQRDHLRRVSASGLHLLGLVEDILDLAKVEAGRMEVAREPQDARGAVAAALALVLPQAAAGGIAVEDGCGAGPPLPYVGDDDRVRQILVNLLSNAVKFTEPGGRVTVRAERADAPPPGSHPAGPGPCTLVHVSDTGIGITPELIETVFRPFVQAEDGHTRTRGGTGLGLTISREFARLMGGDLTARSTPGGGSTFTLCLPTRAARVPEAPAAALVRCGEALRSAVDHVVAAFAARLAEDPAVPMAHGLGRVELEDHASTFLADIAQALVIMGERGTDPELLRDGSDLQRLISERHGAQRARLRWTGDAVRREYRILLEEVQTSVRGAYPGCDAALILLGSLLARAEEISMAGFRGAGGAG